MKKYFTLAVFSLLFVSIATAQQSAMVQVIHNCADAAADTVDVWVNGTRALPNFRFRTATPFTALPAGIPLSIHITPNAAADTNSAVFVKRLTLTPNEKYTVIASGIVSQTGYTPNVPFDLIVRAQARQAALDTTKTDLLVYHGSTDAPAVDVNEVSVPVAGLITNLAYGNFAGYLPLNPANYTVAIAPAGGANIAWFQAPLQTLNLRGAALTVVASGFLNPAVNSNGASFGLWVAAPGGGNLIPLPSVPNSIQSVDPSWLKIFPNPARDVVSLTYPEDFARGSIQVQDALGRVIFAGNLELENTSMQISVGGWIPGVYQINLKDASASRLLNRRLVVR
ncbi:MAG: DUF4397 domain-containing protein [Bacteroidia bacterium]|jgi:hypothetical protein